MKTCYNLRSRFKPLLSVGFFVLLVVSFTKLLFAATTIPDSDPIFFNVNIPAQFKQNITAPNLLYSITGGNGLSVSSTQTPIFTNTGVLSLQGSTGALFLSAGDGISLDGLKITNTGILSLSAGDGISVDGNKITNAGILSLSAGEGITINGNTITNSQVLPDYTLSGWTKSGSLVSLTTPTDSVLMGAITMDNATITNGKSLLPNLDLGADLGSNSLRFDSLYVANINSNSSQSFSGQTTFSYPPKDNTINEASVLIDPLISSPSGQLLGLSVNGYQKAFFDIAGNLSLGYSGLTPAPTSTNPLNIYGHSDTLVANFDTNGNLTMGNTLTPSGGTLNIAGNINTSSLNIASGTLSVTDKVGIGTTNPSQMLTVDGGLDTTSLLSPNLINRTSENTRINFDSTTTSLITNGNTGIFLDNTGNVGIGTTTPNGYKLNINGTTNLQGAVTAANNLDIHGQTTLANLSAGTTNIAGNLSLNGPINSVSGFLGLGTLTPSSQLDIQAAYGTSALSLTNAGNTILGMDAATNGLAMNLTTADPTNRLNNGTFDTNLLSWTGTQNYSLNDEFTTAAPTTLVSGVSTLTNSGVITPATGTDLWDAPAAAFTSGTYAWTKYGNNTIENDANTLKVTYIDNSNGVYNYINNAADLSSDLTLGTWYQFRSDRKVNAGGNVELKLNSNDSLGITTNTNFQTVDRVFRGYGSNTYVNLAGTFGTGEIFWLDNLSVKPLTLPSLFSTTTEETANKVISAGVTVTAGTQAGLVLNLDSASNPQNFIIAYHDGTSIRMEKCVNGVYTSLVNSVAAYVPGAPIRVAKNGNIYTISYVLGVYGTPTVSDASIVNNTLQGLFSTYASNSFSNFIITTNLDGTLATDGVNTRTVVDTNSKLSITGGQLSFATGGVDYGNPGLWYPIVVRGAGKMITGTINSTGSENLALGFDSGQSSVIADSLSITGTNLYARVGTVAKAVGTVVSGTTYQVAIIMKATGMYYYIKGGTYTNWTLLYISSDTSTDGYPGISGYTASVFSADNLRIPTNLWLPTPLAYDTFATDSATLTESIGPDNQSTPQLNWTGGTKFGGSMSITPTIATTGGPLNDGNLVTNGDMSSSSGWDIGNGWGISEGTGNVTSGSSWADLRQFNLLQPNIWYQKTYDLYLTSGSINGDTISKSYVKGQKVTSVTHMSFQNGAGIGSYVDNVSLRPFTLSSLFSTVQSGKSDVVADVNILLGADGIQAGLVTNLDSATTPTHGIVAYITKTGATTVAISLEQFTSATNWDNLINSGGNTYVAGGTLRVVTYHSDPTHLKVRVYYDNKLINSEQTITDASIINNTTHGLFSTYSGNTFDNFTLWPRGNGGEFNDIPADDLIVTQDTTIKRSGAASAKLVAGTSNANFLQQTTIGDTNTYTLTTYAYTNGAAVTSSDLELFYDTAVIPTIYEDMGSGWYRLQGTITGSTEAKNIGVRVKAGKTVYLDNITLTNGISSPTTMYVYNSSTGKANLNVQGLIDGTLGGIATFTKAGTIGDSDFSSVSNGLMGIDTLNHRLYFRENGTWSYIARTGGFQIPVEEAGDMAPGDLLLPYVESKMSDGALHGLYSKLSDIMTGGTATITKFTDHVDVRFNKPFFSTPVINISLIENSVENDFLTEGHEATVTDLSSTGFSIYLGANALRDYTYSWTVLQIPKVITTTPSSND